MLAVGALMRAEKRRQNKRQIPATPRDLSIHKDISNVQEYIETSGSAVPVISSDGTEETMMGEL